MSLRTIKKASKPDDGPLTKMGKEIGSQTTAWILPCNPNSYRIFAAFTDLDEIDWRQNRKYSVGDVVYIYCSHSWCYIAYKAVITQTDIPRDNSIDDSRYVIGPGSYGQADKYIRIRKIGSATSKQLTIKNMRAHGLNENATLPGPMRVSSPELQKYIEDNF